MARFAACHVFVSLDWLGIDDDIVVDRSADHGGLVGHPVFYGFGTYVVAAFVGPPCRRSVRVCVSYLSVWLDFAGFVPERDGMGSTA